MRKFLLVLANLFCGSIYFAGFAASVYALIRLWVEMRYGLVARVILSALYALLIATFVCGTPVLFPIKDE